MHILRTVLNHLPTTASTLHHKLPAPVCRFFWNFRAQFKTGRIQFRWFLVFIFVAIIPLFISQCAYKNPRKGNIGEVVRIINQDNSVTYLYKIHNKYMLYSQPEEFDNPVIYIYTKINFFMSSFLKGENNSSWTQLISIHSNKVFDVDEFTLESILQGRIGFYEKFCVPEKISSLQDFSDIKSINNYESTMFVLACGEMTRKDIEGSLETFHVNIKVPDGYYSVIWSERGPCLDKPIAIDREKWMKRFEQLQPISIFDHFPPKNEELKFRP